MALLAAMIGVLAAQAATAPVPELQVLPVPGKGYRVTAPVFPAAQLDAASARMMVLAAKTCGKLKARFGRFDYNNKLIDGVEQVVGFGQRFTCYDPATDPYKPAAAGWRASAQDSAQALDFAKAYLAAFDAVNARVGVAMMEPIVEITEAEWRIQPQAFAAVRGAGSRRFEPVQWSYNPDGAGHPGAYATITFYGSYAGLHQDCGQVVLWRRSAGEYLISRQLFRAVAKADVDADRIKAADARQMCGQ